MKLNYSVVMCTYNRPDVVKQSLRLCLKQTLPPKQVIVVDATPDWESLKNAVIGELDCPPEIELVYLKADKKSAAAQRNQGILAAEKVDVLFFIDDDSFMYDSCAENVLKLYEKDVEGAVAGIQAALANHPPESSVERVEAIESKKRLMELGFVRFLQNKLRVIFKYIFLMSSTQLFIPYWGKFERSKPVDIRGREFHSLQLFQGCRMSFRYELIRECLFDGDLVKYSAGEDSDLSYRISHQGHLLECSDAFIFHKTAAAGRLSRFKSTSMYSFNLALFVRKNSTNLGRDRGRYLLLSCRRVIAEFFKDLLSMRFSFPQLRGLLVGTFYGLKLLFKKEMDHEFVKSHLSTY